VGRELGVGKKKAPVKYKGKNLLKQELHYGIILIVICFKAKVKIILKWNQKKF
jgi:hypothetical protein